MIIMSTVIYYMVMGVLPNTRIFHIFTSEDMKKYVTREKRACFPAGFITVLCSLVPTSDHIIKSITR